MDELLKITGLLGFLISVATFALTRWERRASISFGLDPGDENDFGRGCLIPIETVNVTITNTGARPVQLDLRTLEIQHGKSVLLVWREDHYGSDKREVLLKPSDELVLGVSLKTFEERLGITSPEGPFTEESFGKMFPLRIRARTVEGVLFSSNWHKYWASVGEFHRGA
jgi:hypothetical protein